MGLTPTATADPPDRALGAHPPLPLPGARRLTAPRALAAALLALAAGAIAVSALPVERLLAVRSALFNHHVALADFRGRARLPPDGWIGQETPEARAVARRALLARLPAAEAWLDAPGGSAADEAAALLARLPSTPMVCSRSRDLIDKAVGLLGGATTGCCSDFVEVFQLLASLRGLPTREIANQKHNYLEYWDAGHARWNLVDPTFGLVALGPSGAPVGALDVALGPDPTAITWRPVAARTPVSPQAASYSSPEAFRTLVVTERSDVVAQDAFDRRVRFLPKPVAQLIELTLGVRPRWTEVHLDAAASSAGPTRP